MGAAPVADAPCSSCWTVPRPPTRQFRREPAGTRGGGPGKLEFEGAVPVRELLWAHASARAFAMSRAVAVVLNRDSASAFSLDNSRFRRKRGSSKRSGTASSGARTASGPPAPTPSRLIPSMRVACANTVWGATLSCGSLEPSVHGPVSRLPDAGTVLRTHGVLTMQSQVARQARVRAPPSSGRCSKSQSHGKSPLISVTTIAESGAGAPFVPRDGRFRHV